ncbi:MAG: bifunctional metallophosphatase/5'-nucleotidase [Sporocytophaga sp.]|uniref:bifunctional metallophosphatase/5'-nucleotidase n=1 Tax=Sporocytophaga sp. TaxID=2231183 RepID=UPI001B034223|nr:bifunctional metallophosphatase/5'-nucleotidase [Sporocytophaga sp.]MBO9702819.1 bifunctional metallophosphatase/5'-nucleotidase [Sporocytophaga sp.]
MKSHSLLALVCLLVSLNYISCQRKLSGNDKPLTFTILQINDVYEIEPLSGGEEGGMARVATVRKDLIKDNKNTIAVLAGDFVSPSFMGTLKYKGQRLAGKQMVDVMNATGVDYVTFGNHEFDIEKKQLQERINESEFAWISSNVEEKKADGSTGPFRKYKSGTSEVIRPYAIHKFDYENGQSLRLGIIGVTLPLNKADSIVYDIWYFTLQDAYEKIKDSCDVIIGLTHLEIGMDKYIAERVQGLDLIIGGHEHMNMEKKVGKVKICKADANAKSAYIHKFTYKPRTRKVSVISELKAINSSIALDSEVNSTVQKWVAFRDSAVISLGFVAGETLMSADVPLEARESLVRSTSTNFTRLVTNSLLYSFPVADIAILNSGSIRIDDQLKGEITQADILRALPFGGSLSLVRMTGEELVRILDAGTSDAQKWNGGFLQIAGAERINNKWLLNGKEIVSNHTYTAVMPTFLSTGKEKNLEFINKFARTTPDTLGNSGIENGYTKNDVRNSVIAYIKSGMKSPLWVNE